MATTNDAQGQVASAAEAGNADEAPEYVLEGYEVVFSTKVALIPVAAPVPNSGAKAEGSNG